MTESTTTGGYEPESSKPDQPIAEREHLLVLGQIGAGKTIAMLRFADIGTATWGKRTSLDLWSMPTEDLRSALEAMLESGRPSGEVDR